jgi:hypothetical protein
MKPALLFTAVASLSLAVLSGCASSQAPVQTAAATSYDEPVVIVPDPMNLPPGAMEVSWTPTEPPPRPEVKARPMDAKPELVAPKKSRGHLFVLPTRFEHE